MYMSILEYLKETDLDFIKQPQPCPVCKDVEVYGNYWCDDCRFNICVRCKTNKRDTENKLYVARCGECAKLCYVCDRELELGSTKKFCNHCLEGMQYDRCPLCDSYILSDGTCLDCDYEEEDPKIDHYDTTDESNNYKTDEFIVIGDGCRWNRSKLNRD